MLKAFGVQIAVDDFGIEYSSLSYLNRFLIDILKIDRRLGLGAEHVDTAIVQALVRLAQQVNVVVIAEDVETALQVGVLQALRCQ